MRAEARQKRRDPDPVMAGWIVSAAGLADAVDDPERWPFEITYRLREARHRLCGAPSGRKIRSGPRAAFRATESEQGDAGHRYLRATCFDFHHDSSHGPYSQTFDVALAVSVSINPMAQHLGQLRSRTTPTRTSGIDQSEKACSVTDELANITVRRLFRTLFAGGACSNRTSWARFVNVPRRVPALSFAGIDSAVERMLSYGSLRGWACGPWLREQRAHLAAPEVTTSPDFRLLFESVAGANLVVTPGLTIVAVTDDYLRATMTRREEILGRYLFDVLPDNPSDRSASWVANLRASLSSVITDRRRDVMAVQRYDIRPPHAEGGGFEERFWSPVNSPLLGEDGEVIYIIHRIEDVTNQVRLQRLEGERDAAMGEAPPQSEERYHQLLDTAPDAMVVVGEDGRIAFVNYRIETLFGYKRAELAGQHIDMLIPARFHAAHAAHVRRFVASPGVRSMGSGLELFGRHKSGTEIPIEVSLSPLRLHDKLTISAAIRDISERKRLEANLKLAADRLASAVESVQDAFALFDSGDRLVLCNSGYRHLLADALPGAVVGRSYEELLDAWIVTLAFADDRARGLFRSARLSQRQAPSATFDVRTRDGRSLRVMDRQTPEGGVVETIWDLTDDMRREEQLKQARAVADSANMAKSEFLSSMSHELRTPLNAILGFAQLLQRDKKEVLTARHKDRVGQILKGGDHLLRLISDILDLSRIEAGGIAISTEPVAVADVLREVMVTLEPAVARAGLRMEVNSLELADIPLVSVDRTRLEQILLNFGSNAIKYNRPNGSVAFRVSVSKPDCVRVTVADTGFGIPLDKQEKLFQPFHRAGQETGPIEGTGIGLTISKRLAGLMRGRVGFRSVPSQGSEFWVEVPIHVERPVSSAPPPPQPSPPHLGSDRSGLVLYVEDNPANVRFMRDLLEAFEGIELVTLPTAEVGVEFARANAPSVIIMDINLPGMSGLEALRVLRGWPETQHTPVIALTAAASEKERERGEQLGFHRYLTKPVDVADLEATLEALLRGR